MNFSKPFAALLAAAALLVSCEQTQPANDTISVTPDALDFEQSAASVQSVTLVSGNVWVARSDSEWITVEPASGSATDGTEIKIFVTGNEEADRAGVVTFICNNSLLKTAAVSVKQKGDKGDGITQISCAEFLLLPDSNSDVYRLRGTVTGTVNTTYGNFYVTDDDGVSQVQVYGATNWDAWKDKVKKGGTVTVKGNKKTYQKNADTDPVIEMVNGVIEDFEEGEIERPQNITDVTVAEFNAKPASTTEWYRMKGTVGEIKNTTYGNFYIQDATGSVLVYGVDNWDSYKADFASGDNITVVGQRKDYVKDNATTIEVDNGYIEEFSKAVLQEIETESVAEVLALSAGSTATLKSALVVAVNGKGCLLTDGSAYIFVYEGEDATGASAAIGDKVTVKGKLTPKSGMLQFVDPEFTPVSSGNAVALPDPKDITAGFDSYTSTKVEYITVEATLKIDGDYTNFLVDGANNLKGSLSYPLEESGYKDFDGARCIIKGFYLYTSSIYVTVCLTEITASDTPYFSVSTTAINAGCNDESASFRISSNVDWTVSCDNPDFALDTQSGNGNASVSISFAKNENDQPKVANIIVATQTEGVVNSSYTIVLTQAKYTDLGSASFVKLTSAPDDWSGTYLLVCEETGSAVDGSLKPITGSGGLGVKGARVAVTINEGVIAATEDLLKSVLVLEAMEGGKYAIKTGTGDYFKEADKDGTKIKAGLQASSTPVANEFSLSDGKVKILSESGDCVFLCNRGSKTQTDPAEMFFRFYNKSNLGGDQYYSLAAYRYVEK